ncbi:MAG: FkbM family methyltransferase [Puniceicoccaceae bacterium]|nr:MAG: FkbM family methyltransferase [Puniceicoccaceae bacterium]
MTANGARPFRRVKGAALLRSLHRILPLGRRYAALVRLLNGSGGRLALPYLGGELIHPAGWGRQAAGVLALGARRLNPEFAVVEPSLAELPAGALVDVGASLGAYTLFFHQATGRPQVAFEPHPVLYDLLHDTVRHNGLDLVEPRQEAVGAESGEVLFRLGINGEVLPEEGEVGPPVRIRDLVAETERRQVRLTRSGRRVMPVPVVRLDDVIDPEQKVALVKIDCQGYEGRVLDGAAGLLGRHRPWVFVELHPALLERFGDTCTGVLERLPVDYDWEYWSFPLPTMQGRKRGTTGRMPPPPGGRRWPDRKSFLRACAEVAEGVQHHVFGRPGRGIESRNAES